jgi:hypothetical protein
VRTAVATTGQLLNADPLSSSCLLWTVNSQGICANLDMLDDGSGSANGTVTFTFVREPIGRFVSGWSETNNVQSGLVDRC